MIQRNCCAVKVANILFILYMPPKKERLKLSAVANAELAEYDVAVKKSSIPNAGLGLFATKEFKRGELIVPYTGVLVATKKVDDSDKYLLQLTSKTSITAQDPAVSGVGRFCNTGGKRNNARFSVTARSASIKATKKILAGAEILVPYGRAFHWPAEEKK
jgi:hypothetical protein